MDSLKSFTLLYVEDDKATVEVMEEVLKSKVKEFFVAYDGEEGIQSYKKNMPDIILTDINMPRLNGIEMAKEIKKINPSQAIILLTAFNENNLLHQSVDLGVDGYVTKPITDISKVIDPLRKTAQRLQGVLDKQKLQKLLEVQGKTAAVGEMLSNIAHQWRQPLSVITMHASSIKLLIDMDEEITKEMLMDCSNGVMHQANYLSETIDDFRDFFQGDTTKIVEINISEVTHKLEKLIKSSFNNNFIKYRVKIENDFVLKVNENQLIQALINICNNAKDAITAQKQTDNLYFFIDITNHKGRATIKLRDSGGGIDKDIIEKVYEPYFTTKHPSIGTGIGLYMSHQIVTKQLKGSIQVENIKYEYENKKLYGAEFTIDFPLK